MLPAYVVNQSCFLPLHAVQLKMIFLKLGIAIEEKDKKSDCLGDDEEFDDWVKIPNDSDFVLVSATEKGHKAFCSALNLFKVS